MAQGTVRHSTGSGLIFKLRSRLMSIAPAEKRRILAARNRLTEGRRLPLNGSGKPEPRDKPKVNPHFRSLIPPVTSDELRQLEANLLADGCRDPLVTWNGTLLDGHNRLVICQKHDIPYKTVSQDLDGEEEAELWIRWNQLGRRNLTDDQRAIMADAAAELESKIEMQERAAKGTPAREAKKAGTLEDAASPKVKPKERTRAKAAKAAKVSERKLKQARAVRNESPGLARKVEAGEVSLAQAGRTLREQSPEASPAIHKQPQKRITAGQKLIEAWETFYGLWEAAPKGVHRQFEVDYLLFNLGELGQIIDLMLSHRSTVVMNKIRKEMEHET